jgi:hypothetical protein
VEVVRSREIGQYLWMDTLPMVGPLTEIQNTGGRGGLGDNMFTSKQVDIEMHGGHPSRNIYLRDQSFPIIVPQDEVTMCCVH